MNGFSPSPAPSAALLLVLADIGPKADTPRAIRHCKARMDRRRAKLGLRNVVTLKRDPAEEAARQEAINATLSVCRTCGLCDGIMPPRP